MEQNKNVYEKGSKEKNNDKIKNKNLVIALVGQPNCGKSTIFNAVAGFKVSTGNFAGTTITFTETKVQFETTNFTLIDLPGTYSISSVDEAEKVTRNYLLSKKVDLIINVVDTSVLSRSLELTIQLLEMNIPMIVAFNMIDEANRKGIKINFDLFFKLTGLISAPVTAVKGEGVDHLFHEALSLILSNSNSMNSSKKFIPTPPLYDLDVENCLKSIIEKYPEKLRSHFQSDVRFVAIRLLEMDDEFESVARSLAPDFANWVVERRRKLAKDHNWTEAEVFSSHRHANVLNLYEKIATHLPAAEKNIEMRDRLDRIIMNPLGGLLTIILSFLIMFYLAFNLGDLIAGLLQGPFEKLSNWTISSYNVGIIQNILIGLIQGIEAGAGIVLPYLFPLLLLLGIFEDTGLLPRIAFMVDGLLHRFGLHGKAIIPMILGYGCSVPAIMATRNLESSRDRFIARLTVPFISCSARTVVILGLAGKYLGPWWAASIYFGNVLISLLVSLFLTRIMKDVSSYGIIMEVPPLRAPHLSIALKKVWIRLREFLALGWPVVIVSSVLLSILSLYEIDGRINTLLSPLTVNILQLPVAVGMTMFLGIFRKELALIMLAAALGTSNISSVMSKEQIFVFTVFTVLYIPCIASLAVLWKEGGWKTTLYSALLNLVVAIVIAGSLAWIFKLINVF
ncbi:MAG: ferrous iron transport protein B [Oligoflexia bacterium]|nr:ferrous iron transport protein B [Oligoflexia bacterium]